VLVTHDPLDAMVLGDRLVVVERGTVVQEGAPAAVAREPRTDYVARLVGLNLLRGNASGRQVQASGGGVITVATPPGDGDVFVAFPPSGVSLHTEQPHGSARNVWKGVVSGVEQHGGVVRVRVDGAPPVLADVTAAAVAELQLTSGSPVWVAVKATEIGAYPA
jgi:molybdate transport system ATP-binding protein